MAEYESDNPVGAYILGGGGGGAGGQISGSGGGGAGGELGCPVSGGGSDHPLPADPRSALSEFPGPLAPSTPGFQRQVADQPVAHPGYRALMQLGLRSTPPRAAVLAVASPLPLPQYLGAVLAG
jgi:hypothetical protein